MPQLRQNIITGEWVVFAPERAKRPSDYIAINKRKRQNKDNCPFCVDSKNSEYNNRIKRYDDKLSYIIPNKYPAFIEKDDESISKIYKVEDGFYNMKMALGGHDVIVVKDHDIDPPKFSQAVWEDLFDVYVKRLRYYDDLENVNYAMPIYNYGPEAGASLDHPHSQIFASSIVPNNIVRELTHCGTYYAEHKKCAFCDLIEHEISENTRIIFENDHFIAFTFYAARFPFEVWILPKKHQSHFYQITPSQRESLAKICRQVFNRLDVVLNDPPFNYFLHSGPLKGETEEMKDYHWHLEVAPRLATYGGFEMGSGVIIDIINPETAADYLRLGQLKK